MAQPTLKKGSKGESVRHLQEVLASNGFDPGVPDGHFGSKTDQAVRAFQADRGLTDDGIVGARTWAALEAGEPTPSRPAGGGGAGGGGGSLDADFVHDVTRSTIELLPDAARKRFEGVDWGWLDFPGKKSKPVQQMGPDELAAYHRDAHVELHPDGKAFVGTRQDEAQALLNALVQVRPGGGERRANTGAAAVLTKQQFVKNPDAFDAYIESQLAPLAGQGQAKNRMMNAHAAEAFTALREAAGDDGVVMDVRSAFRERAVAERNAAKAGNPKAVASFSAHSLGLAMDLALWVPEMAQTGEPWTEISTANFVNVVRMLHAPAYKWMYTKGAGFGFYMYGNEPWHWEYNPPGFQERFFADQPALRPRT